MSAIVAAIVLYLEGGPIDVLLSMMYGLWGLK